MNVDKFNSGLKNLNHERFEFTKSNNKIFETFSIY